MLLMSMSYGRMFGVTRIKTKRAKVYMGLRLVYVLGVGEWLWLYAGLTWGSRSIYAVEVGRLSAIRVG